MSNLVIVAIPDENDRVWKISSEKIPHLTLLFLGESDKVANTDQIVQFVEHAANTTLKRFYLPVDRRGELGDDQADVLFFKKGRYDYKAIRDFRVQLLKNDSIRTAYDSASQFEGPWTPHLTLGYPTTPAKTEENDYGGFYSVDFNKIAVWFGDFDGPDFLLKDHWDEFEALEAVPMDVAMSGIIHHGADDYEQTTAMGEAYLAHYGVKGMKWGVRKPGGSDNTTSGGETKRSGIQRYIDPTGHDASTDVVKTTIGVLIPIVAPLTWPAQIRLIRGGVRGAQAKAVDRQEKRFTKNAMSPKNFAAIHNGAIPRVNKEIAEHNKKYPDLSKPGAEKKYDAAVLKSMQDAYKESANSLANRALTMHLDVEFKNDGQDFKINAVKGAPTPMLDPKTERIKHADDDDEVITVEITGKIKRDANRHIVGFEFDHLGSASAAHAQDLAIEFLEHHGVKGMHWGVTREHVSNAAKSGTGAVAKAARDVDRFAKDIHFEARTAKRIDPDTGKEKSSTANEMVLTAAHKEFGKDLASINAKPEYVKARKLRNRLLRPFDSTTKAYRKEVKESFIKRAETEANKMKNASGTREYTIRERGGDLPTSKYYWEVSSREARHAAGENFTLVEVLTDDDGFITGTKTVSAEDSLAQSVDLAVDFLEHYGVKGMRWGQRKAPPVAVNAMARSHVPHGTKRKTKLKVEGGENHPAHEDAIVVAEARAKLKKSGTAALSNAELQKMAKRLQLETQVVQLTSSRGQKFIMRQLEQTGQQQVQLGIRKGGAKVVKKGVKKAGRAAAVGGVGLALL